MIRDLRFDELERADRKRRLTRLVIICLVVSTSVTFVASRELKIRDEFEALPKAQMADLASLKTRHDAIAVMLDDYHLWSGAWAARAEMDDLVRSIADEERSVAMLEAKQLEADTRIKEEAEAARSRAIVFAERKQYDLALEQFRKALELCDSLAADAWDGGPWEQRSQVVIDIQALESLEDTSK